jgi:hypothetical protein
MPERGRVLSASCHGQAWPSPLQVRLEAATMVRNPMQRLPRKSNGPDQIDRRYRLTPCSQSRIGRCCYLRG